MALARIRNAEDGASEEALPLRREARTRGFARSALPALQAAATPVPANDQVLPTQIPEEPAVSTQVAVPETSVSMAQGPSSESGYSQISVSEALPEYLQCTPPCSTPVSGLVVKEDERQTNKLLAGAIAYLAVIAKRL
jgi:hypothetical protein